MTPVVSNDFIWPRFLVGRFIPESIGVLHKYVIGGSVSGVLDFQSELKRIVAFTDVSNLSHNVSSLSIDASFLGNLHASLRGLNSPFVLVNNLSGFLQGGVLRLLLMLHSDQLAHGHIGS